MPRWAKDKFRPKERRRLTLAGLRGLVPWRWSDPAMRAGVVAGVAIGCVVLLYQGLSAGLGLEREESIVVATQDLEADGAQMTDSLTADEVARLAQYRQRIEESLSRRRPGEALTTIERALSIDPNRNPWSGDLLFARGLAAYQIARSGWGISEAERPTYVEMAVESYARAAETYQRPGARTRFDAARSASFPFQRADTFQGDLGYAYTIASQSRDSVREMCDR